MNCAATVVNNWNRYPCSRNGVVEEDGKWWCRQHAPSAVKARREKASARYNAKWEAEQTQTVRFAATTLRKRGQNDLADALDAYISGLARDEGGR